MQTGCLVKGEAWKSSRVVKVYFIGVSFFCLRVALLLSEVTFLHPKFLIWGFSLPIFANNSKVFPKMSCSWIAPHRSPQAVAFDHQETSIVWSSGIVHPSRPHIPMRYSNPSTSYARSLSAEHPGKKLYPEASRVIQKIFFQCVW